MASIHVQSPDCYWDTPGSSYAYAQGYLDGLVLGTNNNPLPENLHGSLVGYALGVLAGHAAARTPRPGKSRARCREGCA